MRRFACVLALLLTATCTGAEQRPAQPAAARIAAEPRGMSWGSNPAVSGGVVLVTCHGEPASPLGSCDAYVGDTVCSSELPLLCLHVDGRPRPAGLAEGSNNPSLAMPGTFYSGWAAGEVAATPAVPGTRLKSQAAADAICASRFGKGWRMAEFHDGQISGSAEAGQPARHGGWAFYAHGELSHKTRYWVSNATTRANCWDSAASVPPQPAIERHIKAPGAGKEN